MVINQSLTLIKATDYSSVKEFAAAIASGDATVKDMPEMKRVFNYIHHVAQRGTGVDSSTYVIGGALGPRGEDISALVERMIWCLMSKANKHRGRCRTRRGHKAGRGAGKRGGRGRAGMNKHQT